MEIKIVVVLNPATGAISLDGPDMVPNRAMYDYVFGELQRQMNIKHAEAAKSSIIQPPAGLRVS